MSRGFSVLLISRFTFAFCLLPFSFCLAQSDADLGRIRAALDKPPSKLTLQERTPDFRVHIEERRPLQDIFDVQPPWQLEKPRWQPPYVGFDLLSIIPAYVAREVADAKRGHDVRLAREEVLRDIAAYCGGAARQWRGHHHLLDGVKHPLNRSRPSTRTSEHAPAPASERHDGRSKRAVTRDASGVESRA